MATNSSANVRPPTAKTSLDTVQKRVTGCTSGFRLAQLAQLGAGFGYFSGFCLARLESDQMVRGREAGISACSANLDDRFHETGLDQARLHGTGITLVDSSFVKS